MIKTDSWEVHFNENCDSTRQKASPLRLRERLQRQAGLNFTMSESGKEQSFSGRPAIAASMFLAAVTAHS
jgi:hypothetical protein